MSHSFMHRNWGKLYYGTPAEHSMEPALAAYGRPYRWQHPFFLFEGETRYFPDFLLVADKVIIEVDDDRHFTKKGLAADAVRTAALESRGYRVVRCTNAEALFDPVGTLAKLLGPLGIHPPGHAVPPQP
jgi:hypothetical protein